MKSLELLNGLSDTAPEDSSSFGFMDDGVSTGSSFIDGVFNVVPILAVVIFIGVFAFIIYSIVRNYRKIKGAGMDPITLEADLRTKLAQSTLLAPQQSLETKLAELTDLRARAVITNEEYMQARQDLLKG